MATHGLWFWLLINLGHDQQFRQRLSKRSSAKDSQQCPSQKPQDFNSFLWVMKRNPPVYFFGTIHVPYTKVWDYIPSNSKKAFEYTQNIYFELDLTDPVTRSTLARCQILPNGIMLREVIPRTLYKRIRRHLSYIRKMMSVWMTIPWEQRLVGFTPRYIFKGLTRNWYRKRPIWIMLLLNALTEDDIKAKGRGISVLDTFLIREANSQRKKTGSIESVEDQCRPLNAVNNSQVILALNQTLVLHERIRQGKSKLKYSTNDLIYHYNCGDLNDVLFKQDIPSLGNLQNASFSNSFEIEQTRKFEEYLKEELVYKRNKRMSKRIARLIQKKPRESFFFAFGAAHFLGNGSIIDILQKNGYKISHVPPETSLPRYGPERKENKNKNKKTKIRRKHKFYIRLQQRRRHSIDNPRITFSSHENVITTPGTVRLPTIQKVNSLLARPSSSSPSINTGQWLWFIFLILSFTTAVI